MAVWSSHDGEDTLFNHFVHQARAGAAANLQFILSSPSGGGTLNMEHAQISSSPNHSLTHSSTHSSPSTFDPRPSSLSSPWNLYYRVTIIDAIELGLLDVINRVHGTTTTRAEFLAGCQARAGLDEVFQQTYMCNPMGAATNHITEWSAIERCRYDYKIIRVHFENSQIVQQFGEFSPGNADRREQELTDFIHKKFLPLFQGVPLSQMAEGSRVKPSSTPDTRHSAPSFRLGFDVAASGQGDLAVIYIDERKGEELWLRALFTCRTEDWNFIKTVLFKFLRELRNVRAAGDESGLGRQICWEARQHFGGSFTAVNFSSKKHDLGFALMNQLATAQKRFPKTEQDIAADYFALRKSFQGNRWVFSESPNHLNSASHCDIAWAGALATHAHIKNHSSAGGAVIYDNGWSDGFTFHPWTS
jgi:phage FluMu gp28-like protein